LDKTSGYDCGKNGKRLASSLSCIQVLLTQLCIALANQQLQLLLPAKLKTKKVGPWLQVSTHEKVVTPEVSVLCLSTPRRFSMVKPGAICGFSTKRSW